MAARARDRALGKESGGREQEGEEEPSPPKQQQQQQLPLAPSPSPSSPPQPAAAARVDSDGAGGVVITDADLPAAFRAHLAPLLLQPAASPGTRN